MTCTRQEKGVEKKRAPSRVFSVGSHNSIYRDEITPVKHLYKVGPEPSYKLGEKSPQENPFIFGHL